MKFSTEPLRCGRAGEFELSAGDLIRITKNGRTADDKHRLDNGMTFQIRGFDDEGNIVLTNGMNVGGRAGTPAAPGALALGAHTLDVVAGEGLRMQLVNTATARVMRLRMTDGAGTIVTWDSPAITEAREGPAPL